MIRIHRSKPFLCIGNEIFPLNRDQHLLITALGMMDNRLMSRELLIEIFYEGRPATPADKEALYQRLRRLRDKVGRSRLQLKEMGYILTGSVEFVDNL